MKIMIMRTQKSSRWTAMLLATVVAIITCMAVANATQTITTPNAVNIPYNLAPGANSAAITPVSNKPVLVIGCCTTFAVSGLPAGVGQVNLLHIQASGAVPAFFAWFGLDVVNPMAV